MNGISGISRSSYNDYGKFASGKKVQSAADGAAELSIIEKQNAQIKGYQAGSKNIGSGQDLLKIADGASAGITDYLQRIMELALQASNSALMTDSDRAAIQSEIDQMKKGIESIASGTTYNNQTLLDGKKTGFQIATDGNGSSISLGTGNSTLKALGIEDFDVTGDFDLNVIDSALASVGSTRGSMGAQSNRLDYAFNYNSGAALDTMSSKSRLEDLDFPKAISDKKKQETLQEYSMFMMKKKMEDENLKTKNLFL